MTGTAPLQDTSPIDHDTLVSTVYRDVYRDTPTTTLVTSMTNVEVSAGVVYAHES